MSKRTFIIDDGFARVPVGSHFWALVDLQDLDLVKGYKWSANKIYTGNIYATRKDFSSGSPKTVIMHRVILDTPEGIEVDHFNGNGLDNRRSNIRNVTHSENMLNKSMYANNKCGLKGVCWNKASGKWVAQIQVFKKKIHLGYFDDKLKAHETYLDAVKKHHGAASRFSIEGKN